MYICMYVCMYVCTLVLVPGERERSYTGNLNQWLPLYIIYASARVNSLYWSILGCGQCNSAFSLLTSPAISRRSFEIQRGCVMFRFDGLTLLQHSRRHRWTLVLNAIIQSINSHPLSLRLFIILSSKMWLRRLFKNNLFRIFPPKYHIILIM